MADQQFCQWDAKSLEDTCIIVFFMMTQLTIGCIALRRIIRINRHCRLGSGAAVIYSLVLVWALILVAKSTYSIAIFFLYLYPYQGQSVSGYSRNYARFGIIPGFIVQTIFLQICRCYYRGLVSLVQVQELSKCEWKFKTYLDRYFIIRICLQMAAVLTLNVLAETQSIGLLWSINIGIVIGDSIVVNVFLMISMRIYRRRFGQLKQLPSGDLSTVQKEYMVMIGTSLMRILIGLIFLSNIPLGIVDHSCMGDFNDHLVQSLVYQVFGTFVNHILPVSWALKIYDLSDRRSWTETVESTPVNSSLVAHSLIVSSHNDSGLA